QGTLPGFCYVKGMTTFLNINGIRIFDYPRFAELFRNQLRANAEKIVKEAGFVIEFIKKNNFRKEQRIKQILAKRGDHPGMVHIFSAMEPCATYKPWHDKKSHRTFLKPDQSKCLHYYFYFIDELLGLCYVQVPSWCPFRLQIYFNGHNWLAAQLRKRNIGYELIDNLFISIQDFNTAQDIADNIKVSLIHKRLDRFAEQFCPVIKNFNLTYHWSIMQAEYATDIVFKYRKDLEAIYGHLSRTAIHVVKPENVATPLCYSAWNACYLLWLEN
ncbi:MAG: MarR family transcriptional regulator, partial [Deltaproteobacteria bacterium]|nr:MarR family transcriptional regulator [Deltaproteobacteria bacterium]